MANIQGLAAKFRTAIALGVLLTAVPVSASEGLLQEHKHKWWQSEEIREQLQLTDEQASRIERIFQGTLSALRALKTDLDKVEDELSALLRDEDVIEAEVSAQIDRVELARGALSKARTLMLFRIHRALSVEQRAELKRLDRERRRGNRGR